MVRYSGGYSFCITNAYYYTLRLRTIVNTVVKNLKAVYNYLSTITFEKYVFSKKYIFYRYLLNKVNVKKL